MLDHIVPCWRAAFASAITCSMASAKRRGHLGPRCHYVQAPELDFLNTGGNHGKPACPNFNNTVGVLPRGERT